MADVRKVVGVLLSIFSVTFARQNTVVPALLWTNIRSDFPSPLVGHTTATDEFVSDYLQKTTGKPGHTLIAFIQDKLSLEDITNNADVYNEDSKGAMFANIKRLVETHTSAHLPSVDSPSTAINKLKQKFKGKVHELVAPFSVKSLTLDSAGPNLVIAHVSTKDKSLQDIDNILGSVTSDVESLGLPFTVLYTGEKPSQDETEPVYMGRHLLEETEAAESSFFNVSGCIFVYMRSLTLTLRPGLDNPDKTVFKLPNITEFDKGSSSCANKSGELTVSYTDAQLPSGLQSFSMSMDFSMVKSSGWILKNLVISYKAQNGTTETVSDENVPMRVQQIRAPRGFSYHCSEPPSIFNVTQANVTSKYLPALQFKDLQVQFQNIRNDKFGRANDCEGFFSIGVLSGLVGGLILIAILSCGISMIVNISTMDRFDDPKSKPITVNVAE